MLLEDVLMDQFKEELVKKSQEIPADLKSHWVVQDRYLAMSLLQKSVRRGDLMHALQAGQCLLQDNPNLLWRRLAIIAIEDVGVADAHAVMKVLLVCTDPMLRKSMGGAVQSANCAIELLVAAQKDRSTDDLLELLLRDPGIREMRANLAESYVVEFQNSQSADVEGAAQLALLVMSEVGELELSDYQAGRPARWIEAINHIPECVVSPCYKQVSTTALRKTRSLLAPMIAVLAPFRPDEMLSVDDYLPPETWVGSLPTWALGMHTRVGLDGFRKYASRSSRIRALLSQAATGEVSKSKTIGGLVFRLDCGKLRNRMRWPIGADLEARATKLGWGLVDEAVPEALDIIRDEWELLNDCRCDALRNYLR